MPQQRGLATPTYVGVASPHDQAMRVQQEKRQDRERTRRDIRLSYMSGHVRHHSLDCLWNLLNTPRGVRPRSRVDRALALRSHVTS